MPYIPLLAAIAFALSPLVSSSFGGFDADAFPIPQDDPPVQPAGWAFSIWGLIYLWLIAHAAFGATARREDIDWAPARLPLTLSLAIGAAWIPVANTSPVWATILICAMLGLAVIALFRAPARDRLWALAPIGLYAGWLLAASCVSLGLLAAGWGLAGPLPAAYGAVLLGLVAALALYAARPSAAFPAAIAWALAGIAARNFGAGLGALALAGALIMAALAARALLAARRT